MDYYIFVCLLYMFSFISLLELGLRQPDILILLESCRNLHCLVSPRFLLPGRFPAPAVSPRCEVAHTQLPRGRGWSPLGEKGIE